MSLELKNEILEIAKFASDYAEKKRCSITEAIRLIHAGIEEGRTNEELLEVLNKTVYGGRQ